ncbi:MAG TPA: winged helix-turn-helix domain-containing protein [Acidobacteriaceae bacterium]|nr:winged helix-turn-helix domain-containing protein [Acidobacteriaceae bacterium]
MQTNPGIVYQFGPFEVNPASGELLKNGRRIRVQELPCRLLVALLESPGEVISREELRSRLWPDDTFVDFDSSLRVAVGKLREALDDNAEAPRYVETIPKRGYRFLVTEVRRLEPAPELTEPPNDPEPLQTSSTQVAATQDRTPLLKFSIAAVTAIILMAGGMFFWYQRTRATPLTDKDVLVLADFINTTGDPVFDGTLRQALAIQLEQSPFLKIMDDEQVHQTIQLMSLPRGTHISNQIAQDICVREAGAATIDGSIANLGKSYVVTLQAIACPGGATLAREQIQADDKEHVLSALGGAATAMRGKLGESRASIQKFDTPLEQATTTSLEALKAYSSGIQTTGTKGPVAAIPFFKRAIELDPNFAAAYAWMGIIATGALEPSLSVEYRTKAYELRDRTSAAERYWVIAAYEKGVTGNIAKAIEACDLWIQAYPRSYMPRVYLGGAVLPIVGQYERAAEESTEGIRLSPDYPFPYAYRILSYTALNRFDEAKATYAQAVERKLQSPYLSLGMYNVAFAQNDTAGMTQQVAKMEAQPRWGHTMLFLEGDTAAYYGHFKDAREFSRRAMDSAQLAGEKDATAIYSGLSGLREVSFGHRREARRQATFALKLSTSRDVEDYAALALAYSGDDAEAIALADDLNKRFPEDTLVQFNYLPSIRGKLALNKGNASDAIKDLEAAVPYELGVSKGGDFVGNMMFPVFVRGEAYLASRQGGKAVAEFQKILDHRGLVLNQPIGALAHLGLGRAYVLQGDIPKAKAAYQDFLTLWKDADPDIPVLQQAKTEYAKF